jgi:hypothetical protein
MIEDFWNELNEGEIHVRDSLQFELKSEFFINPHLKHNVYRQEVFLFIPNALQINSDNYSKQHFYLDQTNLIRYKTPLMTLSDLINLDYSPSPLTRLYHLINKSDLSLSVAKASDELKLFAAIFRGAIRERTYKIIKSIFELQDLERIPQMITYLCSEISEVCHKFRQLQDISHSRSDYPQLIRHFRYIDEFVSTSIEEFLVILLKKYRSLENYDRNADKLITQLVIKEKLYRKKHNLGPKTSKGHVFANESILYRQGLLHRFVLESLMLKNFRFSPEEKHRYLLGAIAAGFAMMVYMGLLIWKSSSFVINSFPFAALAVFLYIIKDRIKEGFKAFYSKQAPRWFPDYSTKIRDFKGFKVGKLTESFAFIDAHQLPSGFLRIRNHHFHEELQALHRHETIIQYKREVTLTPTTHYSEKRRRELTIIFRLNIYRFLQKASNAFQTHLTLDTYTQEISERLLPKIYHLNIIIRNSFLQENTTPQVEIKKYRVVVDKNGIKRVEHIKSS